MADLPATARIVIIGGGAVGTSALYHLARCGWSDCVLLEKNELTCGSTWHAAGNIPNFSISWAVMNMQRYGCELYRRIGDELDYPINYHVTGSVRLAHSKARMQEFEHVRGMAAAQGLNFEMMSPADLKTRYPFMETHDLEGGLWDALDGDMDPAQITQAFARGARQGGAQIVRFCPATGVRREKGEWIVETEQGEIRCEYVVNAAGYYAQRVGEWFRPFGAPRVPMMTMSHQYMLTDESTELAEWTRVHGTKLPILRDVDTSYYLRQEKNGFNLGPYERSCRGHWMTPDDPMPEDFSYQLFPDDLDRLEWYIEDAMARVPLLATSGISKVINGPIPYTPDGNPLIGPTPGVPNAFQACAFTFGIAQSGGAGKVLAEWVTEGQTEWDMWPCDPRRFTSHTADQAYCDAKGMEVYGHEYAMHFPHHEWPAGRNTKLSTLHDRLLAASGVMGAYNGWERANWFATPGDDTSEEATETWDRNGPWEPRVRAECEAVRDGCGVIAISGFSRLVVEGARASEWLDGLTTSRLPPVGRVGLAYFTDSRGRIVTEMSVIPRSADEIWLITAAAAQWHDRDFLGARATDGIAIHDRTEQYECLLLTGPKTRELLAPLTDADLAKPWLSSQQAKAAGCDCVLLRVSFAGELGWEIHCAPDDAPGIWDALNQAGAAPFGMYALNSLRLEKGYRSWKGDLSSDYTALEAGLDRFIDWTKPDFPGKSALEAERTRGPGRKFVTLVVDAGAEDAPPMSLIRKDGEIVGEVTSGGWGYRVGASLALGAVRTDLARAGTEVEVEIFGERRPATVQNEAPLWDPAHERIRA
jgi:dimethylglycine dehydrogenase